MDTNRIYSFVLDIPIYDNAQADRLGARWDGKDKVWRIDCTARHASTSCAKWNPRVYLSIPAGESNRVKKEGAKWDSKRRQWYIDHHLIPYAHLETWLPRKGRRPSAPSTSKAGKKKAPTISKQAKPPAHMKPSRPVSDRKEMPPKKRARAGNAAAAATLRITHDMTVSQLKDECRLRGVRGFSNKPKDWLLHQLGVGTVWEGALASASANDDDEDDGFYNAQLPPHVAMAIRDQDHYYRQW